MKTLILLNLLLISTISRAAVPHSSSFVSCKTLNSSHAFTLQFIGHPTEPKTIRADFLSVQGSNLHTWNTINGVAQRGFIKVQQLQIVGPFSRLNTTVLSDYNPTLPINTDFPAKYRQWVDTVGELSSKVVEYDLVCTSPY